MRNFQPLSWWPGQDFQQLWKHQSKLSKHSSNSVCSLTLQHRLARAPHLPGKWAHTRLAVIVCILRGPFNQCLGEPHNFTCHKSSSSIVLFAYCNMHRTLTIFSASCKIDAWFGALIDSLFLCSEQGISYLLIALIAVNKAQVTYC